MRFDQKLLMRQIMPIAAGLAGGIALSSFAALSRSARWGGQVTLRAAAGTTAAAGTVIGKRSAAPAHADAGAVPQPSWRDGI
ncbi:MAG: hypothetical protein ACREU2_14300 [Steroidobacteraceae bacterium]